MPENQQSDGGLDILVQEMISSAKTCLDKNDYAQAANCYEIGNSFDSKSRELYFYGGKAYFFLKNYKKSVEILKKAKKLCDTVQENEEVLEIFIPALLNVGDYNCALENSAERIKNLKKGNPNNANIQYTHAFIFYNLGNFSESQKHLMASLQENTAYGRSWYLLGLNFLKTNNPANSLKAFEKALSNKFNNLDLIYNLAIAYAMLDKKDASLKVLETCIRKDQKYRTLARETPVFSKFISDPIFAKLIAPTGNTLIRRKDTKQIK